jgi:hypothetical protein
MYKTKRKEKKRKVFSKLSIEPSLHDLRVVRPQNSTKFLGNVHMLLTNLKYLDLAMNRFI